MNQEPTIKDVFEIVEFIRDNSATKDDLQTLKTELKEEIRDVKNEMISHVDAFVGMYQKHEQELAAVVARVNRFEEKLNTVLKHLNLQSN